MAQKRKRQSTIATSKRLDLYPREWLDHDPDPAAFWLATQEEDFPAISLQAFVNDLHTLARAHSKALGYYVKASTSTKGLEPNEVEFRFDHLPDRQAPVRAPRPRDEQPVQPDQQQQQATVLPFPPQPSQLIEAPPFAPVPPQNPEHVGYPPVQLQTVWTPPTSPLPYDQHPFAPQTPPQPVQTSPAQPQPQFFNQPVDPAVTAPVHIAFDPSRPWPPPAQPPFPPQSFPTPQTNVIVQGQDLPAYDQVLGSAPYDQHAYDPNPAWAPPQSQQPYAPPFDVPPGYDPQTGQPLPSQALVQMQAEPMLQTFPDNNPEPQPLDVGGQLIPPPQPTQQQPIPPLDPLPGQPFSPDPQQTFQPQFIAPPVPAASEPVYGLPYAEPPQPEDLQAVQHPAVDPARVAGPPNQPSWAQ